MVALPTIDPIRIGRNLNVEALGNQNGRKGVPAASDVVPDEPHQKIASIMTDLFDKGRATAMAESQRLESARKETDLRQITKMIGALRATLNQAIGRIQNERRGTLVNLRRDERRMLSDFKYFVETNRINHEPEYPESNIFHLSIIGAIVVVESIMNSYFFSKGSDLGLVGGVLQAMLISSVNVGLAVLTGIYALRNLHHSKADQKAIGILGFALYLCVIFFFNLATAHYRAQLESNPLAALVRTIPSLRNGPFSIDNFDAWVLFCIGLMFSTMALIDGYKADDHYPGYGKVHRRYRKALDEYEAAKQSLRNAINGAVDDGLKNLRRLADDARQSCNEYARLVADSRRLDEDYKTFANDCEEAYKALLTTYREANRKVRATNPPAYFNQFPPLCTHPELDLGNLDAADVRVKQLEQEINDIDEMVSNQHDRFREINDAALEMVASFLRDLEEEAERLIIEEGRSLDTGMRV
ncbi:MAG: hypothetical protein ABT940_06750 [Alphaproteobacteria bacterium]